jgi:hypothetical protein
MSSADLADALSELKVEEPLFISPTKRRFIFLVDVSGSVSGLFSGHLKVFDKMAEVAGSLGLEEGYVLFWSSPSFNQGRMQRGVMALPFAVKASTLHTAFAAGGTCIGGGTCPPIGFENIPKEWFKGDPMVYLFTDGQIGCSEVSDAQNKARLAQAIRNLPTDLTIIAVEATDRDFSRVEQSQSAAGGDIYKIVQDERLTGKITAFKSVCRNGTFTQIDKVKAPAGCAPYGSQYFKVTDVHRFMQYIAAELRANPDEGFQMSVAQKLSATLEVLTRDIPQRLVDDKVRAFSRMFSVDPQQVEWIITGAIASERGGQAPVLAHYRSALKDLFKQVDGLLKQDVRRAIGLADQFVSYPIEGRVLSGSTRLVGTNLTIHGQSFPNGGFAPGVPVFPLLAADAKLSDLQDQGLRQWTRAVYGAFYRVHPTADEVIYLVLGDMLKVCKSVDVDISIKDAYRQLARCMLRKKRLNSMQTEFDRIIAGDFPTPNSGKPEEFLTLMESVAAKLGITATPLKLWHEICCALDPILGMKQEIHCTKELAGECKMITVACDQVPDSAAYDYSCIKRIRADDNVMTHLKHIGFDESSTDKTLTLALELSDTKKYIELYLGREPKPDELYTYNNAEFLLELLRRGNKNREKLPSM